MGICIVSTLGLNRSSVSNGTLPWRYVSAWCFKTLTPVTHNPIFLFKLRWNLHNIRLTILKQTIQWRLVALTSIYRTFSSPQKKPCPHQAVTSHFFLPEAPGNYSVGFLSLWIHQLWVFHIHGVAAYFPSASGFFHSASCFRDSSVLWHASMLHSFLCLNNIQLYD